MKFIKAAILPLIGVALSFLFLRPKEIKTVSPLAKEPLARIQRSDAELKKKNNEGTSWKSVSEGEALYQGDQIQTPSSNGAVLEFLESGSTIELEPESTIIIEKTGNKNSLNLLNGGLFVKKGQGLDLKSKGQKISFEGDISYSMGKEGKGELKVLRGKAKASMDGKVFEIAENELASFAEGDVKKLKNIFNITFPEYTSFYYMKKEDVIYKKNEVVGNKVTVKWEPISEDINIGIELGKTPRQLERIPDISVRAENGQLTFPVPPGTFYWKLVSLNDKRSSTVQKNVFKIIQYPEPRMPQDGQIVYITDEKQPIKLGFTAPIPLDTGVVEIALDDKFTQKIDSIPLSGSKYYQTEKIDKEGDFYWRITGELEGSTTKVVSKTAKFKTQYITGTLPPLLISPPEGHQILSDSGDPVPMNFQWKNQDSLKAHSYRFVLIKKGEKEKKMEKTIDQSFLNVKRIPPGIYTWQVFVLDRKGEIGTKSQIRNFQVASIPVISWKNEKKKFLYINEMPNLNLKWQKANVELLNYRILTSQSEDFQQVLTYTTQVPQYNFIPQTTGVYFFKIEAVDKQGRVLARSDAEKFEIDQVPFAPAPIFLPEEKETLEATSQGKIELSFRPNEQTKEIFLELKDPKGNIVGQYTWQKTNGMLDALMPGEYWVYAKSIDKYGRIGQEFEKKKLLVPNVTKIQAPKVKQIQVR